MIVAGVMSGTSADGINVALVRLTASTGRMKMPALRFLAHSEHPYPAQVRQFVLSTMNSSQARVSDLARLNFLLAELYADAVFAIQRRFRGEFHRRTSEWRSQKKHLMLESCGPFDNGLRRVGHMLARH